MTSADDLHKARLEPWSAEELKAHLAAIVDGVAASRGRDATPLDVALELLGGEVEAFALFCRMGHLDPPRPDGKVAIGVLNRKSADPRIDERIRETARRWASNPEGPS